MLNTKYIVSNKSRLRKRTKDIKRSLRRSGIKTIQDVLNTSLLSDNSKRNYIRHRFTCYNNFLKTFYNSDEGIQLRKNLNDFIEGVVSKKIDPSELETYNNQLKAKLKEINKFTSTTEKQKLLCVKKLDFSEIPEIPGLSEKELQRLKTIPVNYCASSLTEENKVEICMRFINERKLNWKTVLQKKLKNKSVDGYLVEMYLENRDKDNYQEDFSDLHYIKWKNLFSEAKSWLYYKFDCDMNKVDHVINDVLPRWIKNNADDFKSKILD